MEKRGRGLLARFLILFQASERSHRIAKYMFFSENSKLQYCVFKTTPVPFSPSQSTGLDRAEYDGNAYFGGEMLSVFVPSPTAIAKQGTVAWKLYNKFDDSGKCASMLTKLVQGGCFVAGTKVTVSDLPYSSERETALWSETDWLDSAMSSFSPSPQSVEKGSGYELSASSTLTAQHLLIPIELVPLGARVPTKNPKPWEYDDSLPDPIQSEWAKIAITMVRTDGGVVDAELIRPRTWIESVGIKEGKLLPMNIEELQVQGKALVTAIEDCPEIAMGEGSVVTGRFLTRQVDVIARVEILGADGTIETLEGTSIHPIWSLDRNAWVPLGELAEAERLQGQAGEAIVLTHFIVNRSTPVYNIEVHGEHVYEVGELRLLVHNNCVYQAFDAAGNVIYVGITSNPIRRAAQHASRFQIAPLIQGLTRFEAKAIEQRLINLNGLSKNGGTLLNKINSIASSNPIYQAAINRAIALGF